MESGGGGSRWVWLALSGVCGRSWYCSWACCSDILDMDEDIMPDTRTCRGSLSVEICPGGIVRLPPSGSARDATEGGSSC